jgi:hypothetical protein
MAGEAISSLNRQMIEDAVKPGSFPQEPGKATFTARRSFEYRSSCDRRCADHLDEQLENGSVGAGSKVSEVLKDRLCLCGTKVVVTLITWKLLSVLFLPRLTP